MSSRLVTWAEINAARMPAAGLAALAAIRNRPDVTVGQQQDHLRVSFPTGDAEVLRYLQPMIGVQFFARQGDSSIELGRRLPSAVSATDLAAEPLDKAIGLSPFEVVPPSASAMAPAPIRIVRGGNSQRTSALRTDVDALARWAETASTAALACVRGAYLGRQALLLGDRLPVLRGAERYWGNRVLFPLGFRPEPELSESILRDAYGAGVDELVFVNGDGVELISGAAFEPLTRAGLRLAAR